MKGEWLDRIPFLRVYRQLEEAQRELSAARRDSKAIKTELRDSRLKRRELVTELATIKARFRTVKIAHRDLDSKLATLQSELDRANVVAAQRALALASVASSDTHELTAPVVGEERLRRLAREQAETYRNAEPFPHIVFDDLFSPQMLDRVLAEFERMDRGGWHHTDVVSEKKWSTEDPWRLGPYTVALIAQLNGGPFVTFLEDLTGIRGLIPDPHLRGGGLHEIRAGGLLGVHADFNFNKRLKVYRRLNLLVYLNKDWQESWGGALELWDRRGETCVRMIPPLFNRAVLFDTSNFSYHGHPHPLACPPDRSRKSVALYYYSVDYPHEEDRAAHTTVFVDQKTRDRSLETGQAE
jgi:hypothetical protein